MSSTVTPGNILLGRGELYFDRFDAVTGLATGERFAGNCTRFEVTTDDELRDKYSMAEATSPLILSVNVRRTMEVAITLDEADKSNLALALMGAEATLTQGSGTIVFPTGELVTARLDRWVPLVFRSVSSVVVKNSAETVTYALTTDYLVDAVTGRLYFVTGGAITAAQVLHVAYAYAAVSKDKVQQGTVNTITGSIRFIGRPAAGPQWEIQLWRVTITPDGAVAFLGDDYGEMPLKARVLADTTNHATEPYGIAIKLA